MLASAPLWGSTQSQRSGTTPGGWSVALGVSRATSDALLIGDSQPTALSTGGGAFALEFPFRWESNLTVEGHLSGTWYDFNNGNQNSGNITVLVPGVRLGVARRFRVTRALAGRTGFAFEYSEARSWTHSRILSLRYDITGPRNYRRGGLIRVSVEGSADRGVVPYLELTEAALWAHATEHSFGARYHWFTFASSISLGLKWHVAGSRPSP